MTLFEKLSDIVPMGWNVTFKSFMLQLNITVKKEIDGKKYKLIQSLPLSEHFTESRIIKCIDFMIEEIQKQNTNGLK